MIEVLWAKAPSSLALRLRRLAKWMKRGRPGAWIVVIVLVLAAVRGACGFYHRHTGHRDEIADAIGSIGFLYGLPQPDSSGSRVIYVQTSEDGLGVFASDVLTGTKQTLYDWPGIEDLDRGLISPLSPDGASFAETFNSSFPYGYLAICRADSGAELSRLEAPQWNVTEIMWLTPEKLICMGEGGKTFVRPTVAIKSLTKHTKGTKREIPGHWENLEHIYLVQKLSDGTWTDSGRDFRLTNASSLTVLSPDTLAWVDDSGLCAKNIASNNVITLFKPQGRQIAEVSYSFGQFLVTCRGERDSLWRWAHLRIVLKYWREGRRGVRFVA